MGRNRNGKPKNRHKFWTCPFFKWDGECDVHCEGGRISMPDAETANEYMNRYCAHLPGWMSCSVARALFDYYDKHEEEKNHEKH